MKIWLWGAAGINHMLIDAAAPEPILPDSGPTPSSSLVKRVMANFRAADAVFANLAPSMWDEIEQRRADFIKAMKNDDLETVSAILGDMFVNEVAEGMGNPHRVFLDDWKPGYSPLRMTDNILSLAEALAVRPLPSYGQMKIDDYIAYTQSDLTALMADIQAKLGFSLDTPPDGRPPTFVYGDIRTNIDIMRHAYEIERFKQLGLEPEDTILEIGGGIGAVALLAHRAGFKDYTIVDLPFVGAIQTYWLGSGLGEDQVAGYQEPKAPVTMLPPPAIKDIPDKSVDLALNINSMPEMGAAAAEDYIRDIRRIAKRFFSINQESQGYHPGVGKQNWVPAIIEKVGGFKLVNRHKFWLGEGYTEELYEIGD